MTDLRKAAEMALEALETLWGILDDIDTASDMAKENDAWYRKRVEALQKKRWDTTITTDGYKLKGGPVEALRQALAQEEKPPVKTYCGGKPNYCTEPEELVKQEPVAWVDAKPDGYDFWGLREVPFGKHYLYTAPPSIEAAVLAEREACAKVCEDMEEKAEEYGTECCKWPTPIDCACTIRARGEK